MVKKPTRLLIIEKGMELFAQKGYNGTSMDDIAQNVGIRKATLYSHMSGKESIFKVIFDEIIEEYILFLDKITDLSKNKSLSLMLHDIFYQYVYYNRTEIGMKFWDRFYYFPPEMLKDYIYEKTVDTKGYLQNRLEKIILQGFGKGEINEKNAQELARTFYYLLIGFVLSTTYEEREIDAEIEQCVSVFINGLNSINKK